MRISTKGRYALRLMLDLALNNTGEPISLKDIARRQEISDKYLEQIISVLNKAKLCKEHSWCTGRIHSDKKTGRIYRRNDITPDRGKPCTGGMRRG